MTPEDEIDVEFRYKVALNMTISVKEYAAFLVGIDDSLRFKCPASLLPLSMFESEELEELRESEDLAVLLARKITETWKDKTISDNERSMEASQVCLVVGLETAWQCPVQAWEDATVSGTNSSMEVSQSCPIPGAEMTWQCPLEVCML